MPESGFWIFLLFFTEFSSPRRVWTEFETKIFSLFFGLSHPVLAKNNAGKRFLIFWIFLLFFSEFSYPDRLWTEFGTIIFSSLSTYLIPFWLIIIPERGFLIFWIFLLLFLEFSSLGKVWTEFGTKMFFLSFSACLIPVSAINNAGMRFFNFFAIFFPIVFLGPSMNGIR